MFRFEILLSIALWLMIILVITLVTR